MTGANEAYIAAIETELRRWKANGGKPSVNILRPILYTNQSCGRIDLYLSGSDGRCLADYLDQVSDFYLSWHDHLHQLQIERTTAVWKPMLQKLQRWTYCYLQGQDWPDGRETQQQAGEMATAGAVALLQTPFPYDVNFTTWAHLLVLKTCRRALWQMTRARLLPPDLRLPSKPQSPLSVLLAESVS